MSSSKKNAKNQGQAKKAKTEKPEAAAQAKPAGDGKLSGLDAAAKVLAEAGEPLNAKAIVEAMLAKGLWKTDGKTPAATIYSAMFREIRQKGEAARFKMVERGKFTAK